MTTNDADCVTAAGLDPTTVNCVVASIAVLTGKSPNEIIAEIAMVAAPGELAFDIDGLAPRSVWTRYLESSGWKFTEAKDQSMSIPSTCLVLLSGHVFAIRDWTIFDNAGPGAKRWSREIQAVMTPPEKDVP